MSSPERPLLRLIVGADDFGLSEETLEATIECFEAGALSSASIMPGMPVTEAALAYAREHPQLDFGVHLTFTGDFGSRPLAGPDQVPTLVDAEGVFLQPRDIRGRALARKLDVEQIAREIEAQIGAVTSAGVPVSHVDSHRHVHKFAPFRAALAGVLPRLGIQRVRTVQDVYVTRPLRSPTYWSGRLWGNRIRNRFETTDHFFMAAVNDPPWAAPILERLATLEGSLEIGVHPGSAVGWRARDREAVLELAQALGEGVERVDWRTLREDR
jgi:chitin disaccharide deacetylase